MNAVGDNCALVMKRLASGDRVRLLQDFYGVQYAEILPRWQFWRRRRVRLNPSEFDRLKAQLKGNRSAA